MAWRAELEGTGSSLRWRNWSLEQIIWNAVASFALEPWPQSRMVKLRDIASSGHGRTYRAPGSKPYLTPLSS